MENHPGQTPPPPTLTSCSLLFLFFGRNRRAPASRHYHLITHSIRIRLWQSRESEESERTRRTTSPCSLLCPLLFASPLRYLAIGIFAFLASRRKPSKATLQHHHYIINFVRLWQWPPPSHIHSFIHPSVHPLLHECSACLLTTHGRSIQ